MKKFDPKVSQKSVTIRMTYEEVEALEELFQKSSCKKKIDFFRLILGLGSEAFKASNPDS